MSQSNIYTKEARKERAKVLTEFIRDEYTKKYISHSGKTCYRAFGDRAYFNLLCLKLNLLLIKNEYYTAEAVAEGVNLEYCEGDVTLSFDLMTREQIETNKKNFNWLEYAQDRTGRVIITNCTYDPEYKALFGIWLGYQKNNILGYYPDTDAEPTTKGDN